MHLLRRSMLAIADQPRVERTIRGRGITERLVKRFVAGETLDDALTVVCRLADQGMTATLDQLGENVTTADEARAAVSVYTDMLERLAANQLQPNISIKLTMLGLSIDDELAKENVLPILSAARAVGGFVRIDMEGSAYTERTLRLFAAFHDQYPEQVGIVIQSYLHRARADVEAMIARRARVRLVKGAYAEPETVAFQNNAEIDLNYRWLMELLLERGNYPAIATHDPILIQATKETARRLGRGQDQFEFQMLYGVRRDEQTALTREGYRMRIYVPFGTQWYPYFTRRIAERPANALFVLRQLVSG
ncbi:MAG TPA: proline dehydrogenase family protein [Thermomicrobiales bacterium]|nr:proline dehydrogenase family protein [Thermomicrobiales bacterium]